MILSPAGFAEMKPDTILVCPTTTPAWTPLFAQALGLVTDIGGILAHGSIVAREYGIPVSSQTLAFLPLLACLAGGQNLLSVRAFEKIRIPAVMGTGNVTRRIVSGQRITVDGDTGTVTILE